MLNVNLKNEYEMANLECALILSLLRDKTNETNLDLINKLEIRKKSIEFAFVKNVSLDNKFQQYFNKIKHIKDVKVVEGFGEIIWENKDKAFIINNLFNITDFSLKIIWG